MTRVPYVISWFALVTTCVTAQTTTLKPLRQLDLATCLSGTASPVTHAFAVTPSGLYFLVSPPADPSQYVVMADLSGRCRQTITLPERVSPHSLTVDSGGQISVLKTRSAQKVEKLILNSTGSITSRVVLAKPAFQIFPAGTEFIGATLNGEVNVYGEGGVTTKNLFSAGSAANGVASMYLTAVSGHLLLLVDGHTGQGQLIDSASGTVRSVDVAPQDVTAARTAYSAADQSKATVITSVASQGDGYVYLCLSGIRLAEGALILKIDQNGSVIQRFRCTLPTRPQYVVSGNPGGYMAPALIKVNAGQLYILDRKGAVAQYTLPL